MTRIHTLLLLLLLLLPFSLAGAHADVSLLDKALADSSSTVEEKENRIGQLRDMYKTAESPMLKLEFLDKLYEEYYAFRYDSAMNYVNEALEVARQADDQHHYDLALIRRSLLNARGGFYLQAKQDLDMVDPEKLSKPLRKDYYTTAFWLYLYLREDSHDEMMKPLYLDKMREALTEAEKNCEPGSPEGLFLKAEKLKIVDDDRDEALKYYLKAIDATPVNSKIFASAAYSIAEHYKLKNDTKLYEEWLTKAAVSDLRTPIKENLALQELAVYLHTNRRADSEKTLAYINAALQDALFFGNRLRILEISESMPDILKLYTADMHKKSQKVIWGSVAIACFALLFLIALLYIKKQHNQLSRQNREILMQHEELKHLNGCLNEMLEKQKLTNEQLEEANEKLSLSNQLLSGINRHREWLAKISFDICAKSIDRLQAFALTVKRKIKAHQEGELLQASDLARIPEEDSKKFINQFDKAFLDLYPTFVEELNAILQPDAQIIPKVPGTLTTELRICAFIRLGVKESSEIASLLFCPLQTIYNNRSKVKNKAIRKETFDEDIMRLCNGA